jgi:hypothetical protein
MKIPLQAREGRRGSDIPCPSDYFKKSLAQMFTLSMKTRDLSLVNNVQIKRQACVPTSFHVTLGAVACLQELSRAARVFEDPSR